MGHARLEELPIPLHVVAVDAISGEELLLSARSALEAIMASAAVPGVLPPVPWGDRLLIDGGVANNTPISQAIALGARKIYVLPTGHACALTATPGSALGMSLHALSLLMHARLMADIAQHRDRAKLVVLPPPCPLTVSPVDFGPGRRADRPSIGRHSSVPGRPRRRTTAGADAYPSAPGSAAHAD